MKISKTEIWWKIKELKELKRDGYFICQKGMDSKSININKEISRLEKIYNDLL